MAISLDDTCIGGDDYAKACKNGSTAKAPMPKSNVMRKNKLKTGSKPMPPVKKPKPKPDEENKSHDNVRKLFGNAPLPPGAPEDDEEQYKDAVFDDDMEEADTSKKIDWKKMKRKK